jgi:hypothetical protein
MRGGDVMTRKTLAVSTVVLMIVVACIGQLMFGRAATAQGSNHAGGVPTFEVDATFFKLPNNWKIGVASSVAVDRHDHIWVLHRPRLVHVPSGAPPVLEFDENGNYLQGFGGPEKGYDWPYSEHGIAVDYKDNVWITGNNPYSGTGSITSDDMVLKFTNKGKFLLQIGGRDKHVGNEDTKNVWTATDLFVYPKTNEVFVSDGYGNRRVVVFDADTGAFKRRWGAFGNRPTEKPPVAPPAAPLPPPKQANPMTPLDPARAADTSRGPEQFGTAHGIKVSNDGLVYLVDRTNRRIQVFTPDGKYVSQGFVYREGPASLGVSGIAFSPDPEQRFLYAVDFGNCHLEVLDRKTLKLLYSFGSRSSRPGDFQSPHNMAADSKGNLYTAEVEPGDRAQKFVFKGMSGVNNQ